MRSRRSRSFSLSLYFSALFLGKQQTSFFKGWKWIIPYSKLTADLQAAASRAFPCLFLYSSLRRARTARRSLLGALVLPERAACFQSHFFLLSHLLPAPKKFVDECFKFGDSLDSSAWASLSVAVSSSCILLSSVSHRRRWCTCWPWSCFWIELTYQVNSRCL